MELYLEIYHGCHDSHRDPKKYGSWHENWDVSYGTLATTDKEFRWNYERAVYKGDLAAGEDIYALVVVYSSGDSFGYANAAHLDVPMVNKNAEVAYRNLKALEAVEKKADSANVTLEFDDGSTMEYYVPWLGYFESLDELVLRKFTFLPE